MLLRPYRMAGTFAFGLMATAFVVLAWPFHRGVGLATYRPVRASSRSLLTFFATFPVLTRASSSESESPIQRFRAAFQSCRRYRLPLPSPQRRE